MNPKLKVISDGRRGWFNRSDVLAAGYSDAELRRRLHLLAIRAVTDQLDKVVVSHQSAAVLHGLPIWGFDLERVHVSRSTGRVRSGATLAVHRSPLDPDEITELDGIRVTTVERAITETACGTSFEVGVVLADAALRAGLTSPELLIATADRHRHWRGSPAARSAVRFANGLSESVGESRLRVRMDNHQLPAPSLQVEIRADSGELIGRVDFLLSGKLIVEFDGAQKYGDSADSIVAEKWREDRLRDRGYGVVRVSWPDLDQPRITAARLHRHLLSGEPGAREPRT